MSLIERPNLLNYRANGSVLTEVNGTVYERITYNQKWHIGRSGLPSVCLAYKRGCPFNKRGHFNSEQEAEVYARALSDERTDMFVHNLLSDDLDVTTTKGREQDFTGYEIPHLTRAEEELYGSAIRLAHKINFQFDKVVNWDHGSYMDPEIFMIRNWQDTLGPISSNTPLTKKEKQAVRVLWNEGDYDRLIEYFSHKAYMEHRGLPGWRMSPEHIEKMVRKELDEGVHSFPKMKLEHHERAVLAYKRYGESDNSPHGREEEDVLRRKGIDMETASLYIDVYS